ncbi:phosphoenolpyruvate carboxykinase (GTP) [Tsukamurella tyrosinosolvens]|uniref:phosphoenolpyruvate carboxykinase (GTP) n=1 Tax=Tsukamurella tyrosinosolvens TaxID=57704 RepID=UPI000C7F28B2|nr:phosphoenolpyruvate carboxykinase (GTP) [Tsukamurella tyrosinosolvens]AUN41900.1 phosphoenolpyruvate carboxykinase [Tsukamurella tyrosinosolvens]
MTASDPRTISSAGGHDSDTHPDVEAWVAEVAALTRPARIHWCTGTEAEAAEFSRQLVDKGTFVQLEDAPNSFLATSDPADVARVEDRTFICSDTAEQAGPTNNWMAPGRMKDLMTGLYDGCMTGRTMYVIAYCMGPLDAADPKYGIEITDSEYVALSMRIMTRTGNPVWDKLADNGREVEFVRGLHSVGAPLQPGDADVPWPCNSTKYISHFPQTREIWSYGSGYGGNALLGKKCFALRIASAMARDEGWLAEHMLILKLTNPQGKVHYIAAAFPSACGKTNLAMLTPTLPGWKAETIGDDIAWMRFGDDGRLYATNPEAGFFGVAPGTGDATNPNAIATLAAGNTVYTNTALTDNGGTWWEGRTDTPPDHLIDWLGRDWTPDTTTPAAHPNSRYCTPIEQCPTVAPEWNAPAGVPISAILFGGRRASTIPLVTQASSWEQGVFLGSILSSETTAAATGQVGVVRRDPMAMLPFLGYHAGDYFRHWLEIADHTRSDLLPKIFYVNWFRRGDDRRFLWPGFGENTRVLDWALRRIDGTADAVQTPIGSIPTLDALDLTGLSVDRADIEAALAFDTAEWQQEIPLIDDWYASLDATTIPVALRGQLAALAAALTDTGESA